MVYKVLGEEVRGTRRKEGRGGRRDSKKMNNEKVA